MTFPNNCVNPFGFLVSCLSHLLSHLLIRSLTEPCPSIITKIKRKIHDGVSLSAYLIFTLLRCCLGFTLHNQSYLAATFGDTFAARSAQLSRSIHSLNAWALEGACLFTRLCTCLVLLPLVTFFKVAGFVHSSLSFAIHIALALLLVGILSSLLCLPLKAQIMIVVHTYSL